jgi:Flp pilus assembly protein TadG
LQSQCSANLTTDVRTFATFAAVSMPNPVTGKTYNPKALDGYCNTQPGQIVVVRAYYRWPLIAPGLDTALKQLSDGSRLITSTVAFQNEPFTSTNSGTCPS